MTLLQWLPQVSLIIMNALVIIILFFGLLAWLGIIGKNNPDLKESMHATKAAFEQGKRFTAHNVFQTLKEYSLSHLIFFLGGFYATFGTPQKLMVLYYLLSFIHKYSSGNKYRQYLVAVCITICAIALQQWLLIAGGFYHAWA